MYAITIDDFFVKIKEDKNLEYSKDVQDATLFEDMKELVEVAEYQQIHGYSIEKVKDGSNV